MNFKLSELATDLLLNIINIAILFVIVKALVYKPVKKFLDDRKLKIQQETEEAQKLVESANQTLSQRDEIFEQARIKGEEVASDAYKKARAKADGIVEKAKKEAAEIKEKAESEIAIQKEDMIKSSKDDIADLSIEIAEKILKREINKEDNQKIIDEFFSEV